MSPPRPGPSPGADGGRPSPGGHPSPGGPAGPSVSGPPAADLPASGAAASDLPAPGPSAPAAPAAARRARAAGVRSRAEAATAGAAVSGRAASFHEMWRDLLPIGHHPGGGYRRYAWTAADADCRAWFRAQAASRGLRYEEDRNANQWAWLDAPAPRPDPGERFRAGAGPGHRPGPDGAAGSPGGGGTGRAAAGAPGPGRTTVPGDAVVTGSHLDSVPDGGAFDGPLGVVSAFAALDELRARGVRPARPLAVVNFADEEGARFGPACVGSRLTTGRLSPEAAGALRDAEGVSLPQAMERAGCDPSAIGPDPERLARIGTFVELHVEQGRALAHTPHPVGVATAIWPHGRWRFDFRGEANHAGTTRLQDRRDPMLTYATTVLAARKKARLAGALTTFGKVTAEPGGVNAVPSLVRGWLDARAPDEPALAAVVAAIEQAATERGARDGVAVTVVRESFAPPVEFPHALRDTLAELLGGVPLLPTGAGHDAGVLSTAVPAAMLFVVNPTGISHAPAEFVREDDCVAGVLALADVLEGLLCR